MCLPGIFRSSIEEKDWLEIEKMFFQKHERGLATARNFYGFKKGFSFGLK
jgi:hypothetical protein